MRQRFQRLLILFTPDHGKERMPSIGWTLQDLRSHDAIQQCIACGSKVLLGLMPLITAASHDATKYKMMLILEERSLQMSPCTSEAQRKTRILTTSNLFCFTVIQHCSALGASLGFCAVILNTNSCNDQNIKRSVASASSS